MLLQQSATGFCISAAGEINAIMAGKEQADQGELIDGAEVMQKMRDKLFYALVWLYVVRAFCILLWKTGAVKAF